MRELDLFDERILAALSEQGRMTNVEVAERIGLSHSSCSRRIARLEREGIIKGYRAVLDRRARGYTVRAYCGIIRDPAVAWDALARSLAEIEAVVSVLAVTGEADLMLEILARDMDHYSTVVLEKILSTPGVQASRSAFVLAEVKSAY